MTDKSSGTNQIHDRQPSADAFALFSGSGELANQTRSLDWSKTPLGPMPDWPQSLKIVVRIMLDSRYAMWLGWGPEFTFLYNDAYARMTLGRKHPWALGRSAREVWSEIWQDIGPRAESVVRTGQATWDDGLLLFLERHGFPEETYHTFSYSPVPDDLGGIGGMLCVVTEDTETVIGERRLRTLRELAARAANEPSSTEEACRIAIGALAENPRDLPFVLIYLLDGAQAARLAGATGLAAGSVAAPERITLNKPEASKTGWPLASVLHAGNVEVVADLAQRFGPMLCGVWPEPPQQAVVLPLASPGQACLAGFVVAGVSPRLVFDDSYKGFINLVAGHVATAVANARAYEQERGRAEALAALDRAKTTFFSNISHEFRTPLTLMLGPVEDLLTDDRRDLTPASRQQLEVVSRNGLRLLRLVNTLLDFSRIEAGRVRARYQRTDLAAFTGDLASMFRSACERAGLRLLVDCPPLDEPVFVDRDMWEKIVFNLLSNAFKFTLQGEIAVGLRRAGPTVELSVRDTGAGIPVEEIPRLFERFHRVENARGRTHEGSGIGLALVQELVKLHGGSVAAESVLDQGTTFIVRLPLGSDHLPADQVGPPLEGVATGAGASPFIEEALRWLPDASPTVAAGAGGPPPLDEAPHRAAAVEPPGREDDRPGDARPYVLLADDNADMRRYVVRLLAEHYRIEAVADGEAALASALACPPDLILTDVMMPRLDGFGLLRELRSNPRVCALPVIMLSARAGEESRVMGIEAGADDYLVKPFSARELLARVAAQLQMARMRREASESLRQGEERLLMALSAARMVAWEWNPVADEIVWSANVAEVFGLSPGADLKTLEQALSLVHADDVQRRRETILEAVAACGDYASQFRMVRPSDANVIWMEERGHAVRDGDSPDARLVGVIMDITDRKRDEDDLRKLAADLSEADRRKDEFLATLAHELRNPMAPLRNGLQVMKLAVEHGQSVEQVRDMMERQLTQLVRLVDDLMDVSRISLGKIELRKERVELASVIQHAVETSRPLIDANEHQLSVRLPSDPVYLDADLIRLAQVFSNLLNNAAKYTDRGGHIALTVARQDNDVVVSVRDDGVGIPPHMLPRLFEMFIQVDRSLERSRGGLGIGLSLVKGLVELHGGAVEARSDGRDLGSEFLVRLPMAAPAAQDAANGNAAPGGAAAPRRRVLVVDDNRDAALSLAMMLKLMGNETRTAHDGLEAIDAAAEFRPEVILLDIGMPKLNGYEAARRIREQPWGKRMTLVALTGWGQEEDRRRSYEAGFDSHMTKPVDLPALKQLLTAICDRAAENAASGNDAKRPNTSNAPRPA